MLLNTHKYALALRFAIPLDQLLRVNVVNRDEFVIMEIVKPLLVAGNTNNFTLMWDILFMIWFKIPQDHDLVANRQFFLHYGVRSFLSLWIWVMIMNVGEGVLMNLWIVKMPPGCKYWLFVALKA